MTWSATSAEPCKRSSAWPSAISALASIIAISRTTRPVCSANPVQEPTKPPPPMMETFMVLIQKQGRHSRETELNYCRLLAVDRCEHAIGNEFHERFLIHSARQD